MTIESKLERVSKLYTILDEDALDTKTTKIKLDVDKYKGIVYHYGTVKLGEPEPDETLNVKFDYDIDIMPEGIVVESQKEFETLLGDILVSIIISKENEIRDNNTNTST